MDSHNSHMFNFQFMELMNDNNIIVLAFPSHTTHLLQPLDDVPFANFKTEWYEAIRLFVRAHCGHKLMKKEFFKTFVPCWKKAITVKNIQSGFKNTGVWPVNRDAISDDQMAPAIFFNIGCKNYW